MAISKGWNETDGQRKYMIGPPHNKERKEKSGKSI